MKTFTYISFLLFVWTNLALAQADSKNPTIPLNKKIQVEIIGIDSLTFGRYVLYSFKYTSVHKKYNADFWAAREDRMFKTGHTTVELCRIIQMKDRKDDENINMRGCAFYNGLTISAGDSVLRHFDFSEYSQSPTLRLCTTDK